jgi:hypothetical protein
LSPRYIKSVSVIDLETLPQVPGRVIGMDLSTREADVAFAEVICADPQWLRAEFGAMIAASFGEPPSPLRPAPPRVPPPSGIPAPPSRRPAPDPGAITPPAAGRGHGRQRSPPGRFLAGRRAAAF